MKILSFLVVLFAATVASCGLQFNSTTAPALSALVPDVQVDTVLARLKDRESHLANMSIRVADGGVFSDPAIPHLHRDDDVGSQNSVSVSIWLRDGDVAGSLHWEPDGHKALGSDGHYSWRPGTDTFRNVYDDPGLSGGRIGVIEGGAPTQGMNSPSGIAYFDVLGLYAYDAAQEQDGVETKVDEKLSDWIKRQSKKRAFSIDYSEWKGRPAVLLRLGDADARPSSLDSPDLRVDEYYFDPERDFLPLAKRWFIYSAFAASEDAKPDDAPVIVTQLRVDEAVKVEMIDGTWIPTEVLGVATHSLYPDRISNQRWVVQDVSLAPPPDEKFTVNFPPGTSVVDMVHHISYDIVEAGVIRPTDFVYASGTEPVSSPPELVRQSLEEYPPYDGFELKTLLPAEVPAAQAITAPTASGGTGKMAWIVLAVIGGTVLTIAVVAALRSSNRFSGEKPGGGEA